MNERTCNDCGYHLTNPEIDHLPECEGCGDLIHDHINWISLEELQ